MSFRIGKGLRRCPAAGRSFMDMEAEEAGSARFFRLRQAADIRQHHRPVLERVKGHKAPDVRIFFRTLHIRACRRLFREKFQHAVCEKSDHFFLLSEASGIHPFSSCRRKYRVSCASNNSFYLYDMSSAKEMTELDEKRLYRGRNSDIVGPEKGFLL